MTRTLRCVPFALSLAGCPAYPVYSSADETGGPASSSSGDVPMDAVPTTTDTSGAPDPTTSGEVATTGGGSSGAQATCGDGIVDPGEGCDAGADNGPYAACTDACLANVCGDGKVHVGVEDCDEGAGNVDTGFCRSDCKLGVCGDGFVFAGIEECDTADANGPLYGACDESCTVNRCGDGQLDAGHEECDDGPRNGSGGGEMGQAGCALDCGYAGRQLFLSSQSFTGDMGTRAGADLACETMAYVAGLRHSERYRALLADANGAPNDFVQPDPEGSKRPIILPTGLVLAGSYPELIELGPGMGITTTELGEVVFGKLVWTNVNPFGDAYLEDPASTCAAWNSADELKSARVGFNAVAPGDAAALAEWKAKRQWVSHSNLSCDLSQRIYCIEAY